MVRKMGPTTGKQNSLKLIEIQKRLVDGQPRIIDANRIFLKEGCLNKVCKNGKMCKRYGFLFSDFLLLCKPKRFQSEKLICTAAIFLANATMEVLFGERETSDAVLFLIAGGNIELLLNAEEPGKAHDWVDVITCAILQLRGLGRIKSGLRRGIPVQKHTPTSRGYSRMVHQVWRQNKDKS
ncbi:rho guanine nucleotide exchange factor 39-like isoform X2 [Ornithodoros turicata]|uniref:rho guanine nucleotide exchange factor 39-like isoform X2 n=1 Tax=Ornithodoros turicata TaxID=34597 RepID=UPI003138BF7B